MTGVVMARAWGHVTVVLESDAGANGTIALGTEDNTAILLPAVVVDETNFVANDVWAEATTTTGTDPLLNAGEYVLIDTDDIEVLMATEDMTGGTIVLNVEWWPVTANGNVVAV